MITVHGLLGSPSMELRIAAATADRVVGGRRPLDSLDGPVGRRVTLRALGLAGGRGKRRSTRTATSRRSRRLRLLPLRRPKRPLRRQPSRPHRRP